MGEGRWGGVPASMNSLLLFLLLLFSLHLSNSPASAQQTTTTDVARFIRGIFTLPDYCLHDGIQAACTFVLTCIIRGGTFVNKCGGGFFYTCCVPTMATVRSDAVRHMNIFSRQPPPMVNRPIARPRLPLHRRPRPYFRPRPWGLNRIPGGTKSSLSRTKHRRVSGCGTPRISQFAKRIIGGDEARFGEFPWQAHIRISGYQCGGVLVNHFFVATAAHCVHKARLNQITVHLGEFDTKDTGEHEEPLPKETFAVVEKRIHPMFKYMLTQPDRYDIAVLRLNRPVIYRANILPICLPDPNDNFIGDVGIVAGWGKTDNSFGKTGTNILRKVLVPIISNDECLSWHHHKGIDVKLHYEMFCAGHSQGKMDACLGDSGGPLVVEKDGRWVLAGITSAGFGCAVDHQPGIYHKVSVTAGWVTGSVRT
ncbi:serine protease 27-like isoform X4 [Portunus trituberculatus]|uniref:serine protease 27-like isoform X4 n=1 Tax=Portunus trituberculatus TaxID=210409 RepID=UPI001E1CBB07|nr:serine protease 27-like isoform X4 [Portunus trituberculatus]